MTSPRVYPRGCGATIMIDRYQDRGTGLSPRMRGYQPLASHTSSALRSIPADAGLPTTGRGSPRLAEVYPRGCGATRTTLDLAQLLEGLSPRMRGYLKIGSLVCDRAGSIPADAGLPQVRHRIFGHRRVYPRGCGATGSSGASFSAKVGLSPRMRGYLWNTDWGIVSTRSIPADAGLPP